MAGPVGTDSLPDTQWVERLVARELQTWENDLRPLFVKINSNWAKWNLQAVADTDPFLSSVQSTYPLYAVEQILPRIVGENPGMSYKPLDEAQDMLVARILSKVTSTQMQRMGFEYEARDFVRQGLVAGYSIGKLYWDRRSAKRAVTRTEQHPYLPGEEHLGTFNVQVPDSEMVMLSNEPRFETVNVLDFTWPLWAKTLNQARAVWQRRWITMAELERLGEQGVYKNIDQIDMADTNRWTSAYQPQFNAQGLSVSPPMSQSDDPDDPDALHEVHERWENNRLTVICDRRICIRDEPNPFWHQRKPFIDFTPIPRPFQQHGQALIDTINDANEQLSTLMRQVSDAITYTINPMLKGTDGIDWGDIIYQPGGHVSVPDTEDIEPLTVPQIDLPGALQWRQDLRQEMQQASGVFDLMGGQTLGGLRTATGVSTVIQQATMRIEEMVNVLNYRSMRPFGWMLEQLNAQYFDSNMLCDFSDDPDAQAAWLEFKDSEKPQGVIAAMAGLFRKPDAQATDPSGYVQIEPHMVKALGRLDPAPQVGKDKQNEQTQKRSDASQAAQSIAPILASPQNPINMLAFAKWQLEQYDVPPETVKAVTTTPPAQQMPPGSQAAANAPSPSGPSGENLPTGANVGAPSVAGGVGPYAQGPGQ